VIRIYQAANLPQAHLLAGLLRHAGIAVRIFNENAQGGLGDIPFGETYPEIWIENIADKAKAQAVIAHFEAAPVPRANVFCRACSEENPANFELCWKCGAVL
jgi:hypothetical protein